VKYKAIVIGGSAGAVEVLDILLSALPENFALPILIVQHLHSSDQGAFASHLASKTLLPVIEACDKSPVKPGFIYTAPADYHMLVETEEMISLSVDLPVNWSRPSIDVLFESAAYIWGQATTGVILSGASSDGARGIGAIKAAGGHTITQDPVTAQSAFMPQSAILSGAVNEILSPEKIGIRLVEIGKQDIKL
jgi:two-component system, chemotaxis family, protein-glutamate methylesterase/glutaminase